MKKFLGLILILVCFITPAFAEPVSQEVLNQARTQAGLFMDLKNALGLEWLDEYNAYLTNPTSSPEPSWASSVTELINKNYLSTAFPTDFTITPTGQEVTISRTITSQAIKDVLPIYLPSVAIVGDTVSLLVRRPAQWVAYEAALNGKVDRDGSGDPDILPGASLDFASGTSINFLSNDGKILGVDSLVYKGEEVDTRFVNAAGDNMTGQLTINGNKVWHAGNDGTGSGLDADKLDGQEGAFYRDAGNLNAGRVPNARLSGTYDINISGRASVATNADYAANSDKLDDKHASDFALSGHSHGQYVQKTGDTMTGNLNVSKNKAWFTLKSSSSGANDNEQAAGISIGESGQFGSAALHLTYTGDGYAHIGMGTVSTAIPAYEAIRLKYTDNIVRFFATPTVSGNSIWHAGNDGSGSGLDADLLDGQHGAFYRNAANLNTGVVPVARLSGTYGISITGNAATATNADKLDGYHHDAFVKRAGDTMTGVLTAPEYRINDANTRIYEGGGNSVRIHTNSGYVDIGPQNTDWVHFNTDRPEFYFNKPVEATNMLKIYTTGTYLTATEGYIAGKKILTTADLSNLGSGNLLRVCKYTSPGTYTWTKGAGTKYIKVFVWGAGGGIYRSGSSIYCPSGGSSNFGNYVYAYGGSEYSGGGFSGTGVIGVKGESTPVRYSKNVTLSVAPVQPVQYEGSNYGFGGRMYYEYSRAVGAGGFATKVIDVTAINSVSVVVGSSYNGGNGAVIVEEYDGKP